MMLELKKTVCKLECNNVRGTGFFISPTKILTAWHVIEYLSSGYTVEIENYDKQTFESSNVIFDKVADVAIIEVSEQYTNEFFLSLCDAAIVKNIIWTTFGRPDTRDGQKMGEVLDGKILNYDETNSDNSYDMSLRVDGFEMDAKFDGFSGSPMVTAEGDTIAMLIFKNQNYLSAVSMRKLKQFLIANGISLQPDKLGSFEKYKPDLFRFLFYTQVREHCEDIVAEIPIASPDDILDAIQGAIFYPDKGMTVTDITTWLRLNESENKPLWTGWLQLLTYLTIAGADYNDLQNITLSMSVNPRTVFNIITNIPPITVTIKVEFYFTDRETMLQVSRKYIHSKPVANSLTQITCKIFNAASPLFGLGWPANRSTVNNILGDISGCNTMNFDSPQVLSFGILSLHQLTDSLAKADDVRNAITNLQTVFQDAIG